MAQTPPTIIPSQGLRGPSISPDQTHRDGGAMRRVSSLEQLMLEHHQVESSGGERRLHLSSASPASTGSLGELGAAEEIDAAVVGPTKPMNVPPSTASGPPRNSESSPLGSYGDGAVLPGDDHSSVAASSTTAPSSPSLPPLPSSSSGEGVAGQGGQTELAAASTPSEYNPKPHPTPPVDTSHVGAVKASVRGLWGGAEERVGEGQRVVGASD
jgi:cobalamin biosynthesis Mg chelatase CobN